MAYPGVILDFEVNKIDKYRGYIYIDLILIKFKPEGPFSDTPSMPISRLQCEIWSQGSVLRHSVLRIFSELHVVEHLPHEVQSFHGMYPRP